MQREIVTIIERNGDTFVASSPDFPAASGRGGTAHESWKQLVESIDFDVPVEARVSEKEPFIIKPISMKLPKEWTSGKLEDLFDILDGVERKW